MKKDTYTKSRYMILNQVLSYPILAGTEWETDARNPKVGDLVSMNCAPATEYYLSWVVGCNGDKALLKSIETGGLCWWSNVGFNIYKDDLPEQCKWSDAQYEFCRKWQKAADKCGAYIIMPILDFENNKAVLGVRKRYGIGEVTKETIKIKSWRSATIKSLAPHYRFLESETRKLETEGE
ncbi:hypothetical protein ACOI22_03595 [Glaciecola sp. 2405UD65-10]|uniref:hypothetical protein n=1 Tax=Glaciecola sp. 2405UD65-10 TaxID=3397244 RepID=UPI003B5A130B